MKLIMAMKDVILIIDMMRMMIITVTVILMMNHSKYKQDYY